MKLNARQVETAKPAEKDYKLPDGNGLILLVKTSGAKYWRYRYTFAGKEKMLALGVYPAVSLTAAREKRDEAPWLFLAPLWLLLVMMPVSMLIPCMRLGKSFNNVSIQK